MILHFQMFLTTALQFGIFIEVFDTSKSVTINQYDLDTYINVIEQNLDLIMKRDNNTHRRESKKLFMNNNKQKKNSAKEEEATKICVCCACLAKSIKA